jgi:hypothetical protein
MIIVRKQRLYAQAMNAQVALLIHNVLDSPLLPIVLVVYANNVLLILTALELTSTVSATVVSNVLTIISAEALPHFVLVTHAENVKTVLNVDQNMVENSGARVMVIARSIVLKVHSSHSD